MTVYFAITMLRLGGFSWIYTIGLLQFIVVSLLMGALFIFVVSIRMMIFPFVCVEALWNFEIQ